MRPAHNGRGTGADNGSREETDHLRGQGADRGGAQQGRQARDDSQVARQDPADRGGRDSEELDAGAEGQARRDHPEPLRPRARLRQEGRVRHGVRRALLALQGLAVQLRVPRLRGLDVPQALQAALLLQLLRRQARGRLRLPLPLLRGRLRPGRGGLEAQRGQARHRLHARGAGVRGVGDPRGPDPGPEPGPRDSHRPLDHVLEVHLLPLRGRRGRGADED